MLTPEFAMQLLDHNQSNRPLSDMHVQRIAHQITLGKWKFNGNTIKISKEGEVLDGQHRLWAIIEAKIAVEAVVVYGLERDAFATIDTIQRPRSGGDTVALSGERRYRVQIAGALTWLLRHQNNALPNYKMPEHRVENGDIEVALRAHPGIVGAVEEAMKARLVVNPAVLAFCYYVMANHNPEIAEKLMEVLVDPTATGANHPFFRLRSYFLDNRQRKKDPVYSIALVFKAANLVRQRREVQSLLWRNQGAGAEPFPVLKIA